MRLKEPLKYSSRGRAFSLYQRPIDIRSFTLEFYGLEVEEIYYVPRERE